jgi:hypothetical protein
LIKVVALLHPFNQDRIIKEVDIMSLREIYEVFDPVLPIEHARIMVDDKPVSDFDIIPEDGQSVIIRVIPGGSNQEAGKTSLAGFGLVLLGAALTVFSGGLLSSIGIGVMITGAGMFATGLIIAGVNTLIGQFGDTGTHDSEQLPQIRGARNRSNPWGAIPIVLGKHLVTPPYASTPFTEIVGNDQYLRQLFCSGYSELTLTDYKIGDTLLSEYGNTVIGDIVPEVKQDGTLSAIVPSQIVETNIGQELKYNIPLVRTTAGKCTEISLDIIFPSGLVKYNDDSDKLNSSVGVSSFYKPTGEPDTSYIALSATVSWIDNSSVTKRLTLTKVVPEGQYDEKLTRTTADATSHSIVDKSYWGALRAKRDIDSVSAVMRAKVCTVGLLIKASDQLSGVVDQFNFIAHSKVPVYSGSGSGSSQWAVSSLTSNPAALFLWVLRGLPNPRPASDSNIDWVSLEIWYSWCETSVHECNTVVTSAMPLKEILQKICSTGRASFTKLDGKYTIIQDIPRTTPIQHFSSRNSWGFSGAKAFPDMPHGLKMSFVNKDSGYSPDERIVYDDGYNEDGSSGKTVATKFQSLKVWGITDPNQIWKDARYQIACARLRPEVFTLNCDIEHLVCTRGDLIRITHDVPLFGVQAGRIKSLTADGNLDIIEIEVDELFTMELAKSYGIRIRKSDGSSIYRGVTTVDGDNSNLILSSVILAADSPTTGDLVMFGEASEESVEMLVIAVEPQKDLTARITLIEYNAACYTADTGTIPLYDPKITIPGDWQDSNLIHEIYNPENTINETVNDAAETSGITPTYSELDQGYIASSGGTTTPTIPVLSCESAYKAIILKLDKQVNLRYLKEYQFQVTENAAQITGDLTLGSASVINSNTTGRSAGEKIYGTGVPAGTTILTVISGTEFTLSGNATATGSGVALIVEAAAAAWYSLKFDGIDWKDTLAGLTGWPTEQLVHSRIPADLTDPDDPQPRTLYYRVRRVTVQDITSAWSNTVFGIISLVESGDIPANTITANMITTTFLETAFLDISGSVNIGFTGSGTPSAPNEGDTRLYLSGTKIAREEYTGGAWSAVNGIKIGGTDSNGVFISGVSCRQVVNPLADEINQEFFPSTDFHNLSFETNYDDQNGISPSLTINTERSTSWAKFGSYSLGATSENFSELKYDGWITKGKSISYGSSIRATYASGVASFPLANFAYYANIETDIFRVDLRAYFNGEVTYIRASLAEWTGSIATQSEEVIIETTKTDFLATDHYIGVIYSANENKLYLTYDDQKSSVSVVAPTFVWSATSNETSFYGLNYSVRTLHQDDIIFSTDDDVNPDVFIQHYNHSTIWNTQFSTKDLIFKPAAGGSLLVDGGFSVVDADFELDWTIVGTTWAGGSTVNINHGLKTLFDNMRGKILIRDPAVPGKVYNVTNFEFYTTVMYGQRLDGIDGDLNNCSIQIAQSSSRYMSTSGAQYTVPTTWEYNVKLYVDVPQQGATGATGATGTAGIDGTDGATGAVGPGFNTYDPLENYGENAIVASLGIGYISLQSNNSGKTPASNPLWWKPAFDLIVTISTNDPSGGSDGDIWYVREA